MQQCQRCRLQQTAHGFHADGQLPLYFRKFSGFAGWQAPFMAQPAHPQPQDDFPLLLLRTILAIDAPTTMIKTALMMIVAKFSIIHVSIGNPPLSATFLPRMPALWHSPYLAIFSFMFVVSFVASL